MKSSNKKASRLKITFDIIFGGLILSAVGAGAVILPFHLGKMYDSAISNTTIKEGNILRTETTSKFKNNNYISTVKKVIIDVNHNAIEDEDDLVMNGALFSFSEAKEGRNVIFLQNEFIKTPLAVEDEKGDFNIKNTPSEIFRTDLYKKREKDILKLDIELYDIIFKKQNVK